MICAHNSGAPDACRYRMDGGAALYFLAMETGRPTDFKPEFVEQVKKLAELGATDMEIADFFEVDVRTINRWKITHGDFCQSLKEGKEVADQKVERSLFQRATGFEHDSVKIFTTKSGETIYAPFREFVVPDTTACIFWLKNRRSKDWKDVTRLTGADGEGPVEISIAERLNRARKDEA